MIVTNLMMTPRLRQLLLQLYAEHATCTSALVTLGKRFDSVAGQSEDLASAAAALATLSAERA